MLFCSLKYKKTGKEYGTGQYLPAGYQSPPAQPPSSNPAPPPVAPPTIPPPPAPQSPPPPAAPQ